MPSCSGCSSSHERAQNQHSLQGRFAQLAGIEAVVTGVGADLAISMVSLNSSLD